MGANEVASYSHAHPPLAVVAGGMKKRKKRPVHGWNPVDSPWERLLIVVGEYLDEPYIEEVKRAYRFAQSAHANQYRYTGEPYISHPIETAIITATLLRLDHQSIMAALLHDVLEDTRITKGELMHAFGTEIAELVEGLTKLTMVTFHNKVEAQAENLRKMLLAMSRDVRVILVKLADRLHNVQTLESLPAEKRRRIAKETLEIYAPIANRLGINRLRILLEDLSFKALYPHRYRVLTHARQKYWGTRKAVLEFIETSIKRRLWQAGINARIQSREKHLYSVYLKMRDRGLRFSEVMDIYAFRIIVDKVDTCYRVLGTVHNLYKPMPLRFKDYIAIPKANGYQSLHTVLFSSHGVPVEVQIRTEEMDRVAETGVAAHSLYKKYGKKQSGQQQHRAWVIDLLEIQKTAGDPAEFLENLKFDLFPEEVYVFTPKGDVIKLPQGATPIDFAYAVHTQVGNTCYAATVDRQNVPLDTLLTSGQTVYIRTRSDAHPHPDWLNFVVTVKARATIRQYFKQLQKREAILLGRRLLEKALASYALTLSSIPREEMQRVLTSLNCQKLDDLLLDIGLGERMAALVVRYFTVSPSEEVVAEDLGRSRMRPLAIKGTEGMVVTYAKCCRPIPGDRIFGIFNAGRGIVVHRIGCNNVAAHHQDSPESHIKLQWADKVTGDFPTEIRVEVANQPGALAIVATAIAEMQSNIEDVRLEERDGRVTTLDFILTVKDRKHLAQIMRRIRTIKPVLRLHHGQRFKSRYQLSKMERERQLSLSCPIAIS